VSGAGFGRTRRREVRTVAGADNPIPADASVAGHVALLVRTNSAQGIKTIRVSPQDDRLTAHEAQVPHGDRVDVARRNGPAGWARALGGRPTFDREAGCSCRRSKKLEKMASRGQRGFGFLVLVWRAGQRRSGLSCAGQVRADCRRQLESTACRVPSGKWSKKNEPVRSETTGRCQGYDSKRSAAAEPRHMAHPCSNPSLPTPCTREKCRPRPIGRQSAPNTHISLAGQKTR
jgi:hypothetical protein